MSAPFRFSTSSEIVEITGRSARNLDELLTLLRDCDASSIFHHTYQTLREHHMLVERYPNDFAEWVHESCGEEALAEKLAGVDLRRFRSIRELREEFIGIIESYLKAHARSRTRPGRRTFHGCSSISVITETGDVANDIVEFRDVVGRCSINTIHHHFVTARLRQDLSTNDFSAWLAHGQNSPHLAERLDRIDFAMKTMPEIRDAIVEAVS